MNSNDQLPTQVLRGTSVNTCELALLLTDINNEVDKPNNGSDHIKYQTLSVKNIDKATGEITELTILL